MIRTACIFRIFFIVLMYSAQVVHAQDVPEEEVLDQFLTLPDDKIDLGKVKLTFDHMINPGIDIEAADRKLNAMVAAVNRMVAEVVPAGRETAMHKMLGLRTYLYDPGHWNGHTVFRYDLNDPLGKNIQNKLLPRYLDTRLGNCVSMPVLFVILGQRLGIDVSLSSAPLHLLVVFTDDQGTIHYLETTSGAYRVSRARLQEAFAITDLALENGIYLQKLGKKETVAAMATTLSEYAMQQGDNNKVMQLADVILETDPKNIHAILSKATAAGNILQREFIPPQKRWYYELLVQANYSLFNQAEALGWREPGFEEESRYLRRIRDMVQPAKTP